MGTRTVKAKPESREESLNTVFADLLTQEHQLRCAPEQRVHGRSRTPDLTISPTLDCPETLMGEAKKGTGRSQKKSALVQARQWTKTRRDEPRRMALALCYPDSVKGGGTADELRDAMRETTRWQWAIVKDTTQEPIWREGSLAELAESIRNASDHRGEIERLLSFGILEASQRLIATREAAGAALANALGLHSMSEKEERALRIGTLMLANGALLDERLQTSQANAIEGIDPIGTTERLLRQGKPWGGG